MILNAIQNGFLFHFPKTFLQPTVIEKYKGYIKRIPVPYDTINDYLNATIQSVNFPTLRTIDTTEQIRPGGFKQTYKSSTTFKLAEGFINYWLMYDNIIHFLDFNNKEAYFDDFRLLLLDNDGIIMSTVLLQQPLVTQLSEIQLNYSSTTPNFSTFSVGFKCNYVDVKLEIG